MLLELGFCKEVYCDKLDFLWRNQLVEGFIPIPWILHCSSCTIQPTLVFVLYCFCSKLILYLDTLLALRKTLLLFIQAVCVADSQSTIRLLIVQFSFRQHSRYRYGTGVTEHTAQLQLLHDSC